MALALLLHWQGPCPQSPPPGGTPTRRSFAGRATHVPHRTGDTGIERTTTATATPPREDLSRDCRSGWLVTSQETLAEERAGTAAELFAQRPDDIPRVTPAELTQRLAGPNPPVVLDVRSRSEYARDGVRIPGSMRVLPDQVTEWAADRHRDQPYVLYCT
jgi:Rhodanese-like domain